MPRITNIQARKGTSTDWSSQNPVLASGELGYDLTNKILKLGDGSSNWASLGSINLSSSNITDFNSAISGVLPVKNISAGNNISINSVSGVYTISSTGGGASSSSVGVRGIVSATGTLTSFAVSGGYPVGRLDLFQNGVKLLENSDFTANDGVSVNLSNIATSGSSLEYLINYSTSSDANFASITSSSGNFTSSLFVDSVPVSISGHTHTSSSISDSTAAGRSLLVAVNSEEQRTSLGLGSSATAASGDFLPSIFSNSALTYDATTNLDMSSLAGGYRTLSLAGNVTFTTSNRASGRQATVRLICDGTTRTLTFPSGWVFIGNKPSSIIASKTAVLSLSFFGANDTDGVAAYGVQT